jgi:cell division protein FtsB
MQKRGEQAELHKSPDKKRIDELALQLKSSRNLGREQLKKLKGAQKRIKYLQDEIRNLKADNENLKEDIKQLQSGRER